MCHGKLDKNNEHRAVKYKEVVKRANWDEWFAKYVINPTSRYMLLWNSLMAVIYLISIFMDTLIIGFHLYPLLTPSVSKASSSLSSIMLVDVILKFFLAFKANQTELVSEDVEKDEADELGYQANLRKVHM